MSTQRINVLVYSGTGAGVQSIRQCLYSLRRHLSPNYSVSTINAETIIKEPWGPTCSLLVFPGGGDLGYCRALNGDGNRKIRQFINMGGSYMGFCAGGYYGSARCEFEVGDKDLEVIGSRELELYPGTCRGSAFKGFQYDSEIGTCAAEVKVNKSAFPLSGVLPDTFRTYFNGGSVFVDSPKYSSRGVEVLANYTEKLHVNPGQGAAAVVYCKLGEGHAILTGPHPEFAAVNITKDAKDIDPKVIDTLKEHDRSRAAFLKACLLKLGLSVSNQNGEDTPTLSAIHISSRDTGAVEKLTSSFEDISHIHNGDTYLKGDQDFFQLHISPESKWSMTALTKAVLDAVISKRDPGDVESVGPATSENLMDSSQIIKSLIAHSDGLPNDTPFFNHESYFNSLQFYENRISNLRTRIGQILMYGETVTSTSTLLEKNHNLTSHLPAGTTLTATQQLSGRGRGSNAWISPAGSLMFSFVIRHPLTLNLQAPVVFIQYLAALAVAEAVKSYNPSASKSPNPKSNAPVSPYSNMPIRLKWPNDIYILNPAHENFEKALRSGDFEEIRQACVKIGGILVNSSYSGGDYTLIVGIGLNVSNAAPTTSLNAVLGALDRDRTAQPYALENLLPAILTQFGRLYDLFCVKGFAGDLENLYYRYWLHSGQDVVLENEGGVKAKVRGITTDWGLLRAVEEGAGREVGCQADGNSFDFFKGLIKRKI